MKKFVVVLKEEFVRDVQTFSPKNKNMNKEFIDNSMINDLDNEDFWSDVPNASLFLGVIEADNESSAKERFQHVYSADMLDCIEVNLSAIE